MGDKPGEKTQLKGGRYGLPGISSKLDRVSQEKIYADFCVEEQAYLERCTIIFNTVR